MADHIRLVHSTDDNRPSARSQGGAPLLLLQGGQDNEGKAFQRAYHAAMIARAERDLIEARWLADHYLSPVGHYSPLCDQRGPAFDRMLLAVAKLALTPASTRAQLEAKKRAIGTVWLRAEGQLYDQFREHIALDEASLAKARPAKRKKA